MLDVSLQLLLLIFVANGAPVLAAKVLHSQFDQPVDGGIRWLDRRRVFGDSKTWRGIFASLVLTVLVGLLLGMPAIVALGFASAAMFGDLLSSFIKRRLGIVSSGRASGLDQLPESLFPLLLVQSYFQVPWYLILAIVVAFFILGLLLSRLLFRLNIRKRPY